MATKLNLKQRSIHKSFDIEEMPQKISKDKVQQKIHFKSGALKKYYKGFPLQASVAENAKNSIF